MGPDHPRYNATAQEEIALCRGRVFSRAPYDPVVPQLAQRIRDRLSALAAKAGSIAALAKASNVSDGGLRDFMKARHDNIGIDTLQKIADAADVSPDFFFVGDDQLIKAVVEVKKANLPARMIKFDDEEYVPVPVYDIRAAAGAGAMNDPDGKPLFHYPFPRDWLGAVTRASREFLAMIRVDGDSMEKTLFNGDYVLINRSIRQIGRDGIYVLRYSDWDELRIKRCSRQARTKLITIKSDNPLYDPEEGVRDEDVAVEGRAVWLSRNIGG